VLLVDLGKEEDNLGQSDMPIAFAQKNKDLLLLQMDGLLTKQEIEEALDLAERAAENVGKLQEDSLRKHYETPDKKKFII
jgi:exosome complex component RRP41